MSLEAVSDRIRKPNCFGSRLRYSFHMRLRIHVATNLVKMSTYCLIDRFVDYLIHLTLLDLNQGHGLRLDEFTLRKFVLAQRRNLVELKISLFCHFA